MLTDLEVHQMRGDEGLLRKELEAAGVQFRNKTCKCIFHDDKHPSAGIYQRDGVWKFKCQTCQAGGDIFDVRALINKSSAADELTKESMRRGSPAPMQPPKRTFKTVDAAIAAYRNVEAVYKYTNPATGELDLAVIRYMGHDRKQFTPITRAPGGEWWEKGLTTQGKLNPIYNRGRLLKADTVVVVEGEKCVHALHDIGIIATTSPGGANHPQDADWTPLAGKRCILWPDNDEAGTEYMGKVKTILEGLGGCNICRLDIKPLELPPKGDAADFIERYQNDFMLARDAVQMVLAEASPCGKFTDYMNELEEIGAGNRITHDFPWMNLSALSQALMPGTVTCLFGPPGALKSYMIMSSLLHWLRVGVRACLFALEDDRAYHVRRAHAVIAEDCRHLSNEWVKGNMEHIRESVEHFRKELDAVSEAITDAPNEQISYEMVERWVEERAKSGEEVIIVDPATAMIADAKPWIRDQEFLMRVKGYASRYNTRILLVTHPRKGNKPASLGLDDISGGAAYQRFCHTVLILERNEKEEAIQYRVRPNYPPEFFTPDHFIRLAKTRNGPGGGRRIAFTWTKEKLKFSELGAVDR